MKKLLIPALLLATASSYGAFSLAPAQYGDGRLTDYENWFMPFKVASDATFPGEPSPVNDTPLAYNNGFASWSGVWNPNSVGAPLTAGADGLVVEALFLGETAGWWDDWGYTLNGTDYMLADGVQAAGLTPNRAFGDYVFITLSEGDTLDFFVTGSGIKSQDSATDPTVGTDGGKYYVFAGPGEHSYVGTLDPLASVRGGAKYTDQSYTVVGFEDVKEGVSYYDGDFNDFLFAFRAGVDIPQGGVPEPSTYGLIGAAALLGLVGFRRFKSKKA